jgi:hypothetical protein
MASIVLSWVSLCSKLFFCDIKAAQLSYVPTDGTGKIVRIAAKAWPLTLINKWAWTGSCFQSTENMCCPRPIPRTGILYLNF